MTADRDLVLLVVGTVVVMLVLPAAVSIDVGAEVVATMVFLVDPPSWSWSSQRPPPRARRHPQLPVAVTVRRYLVFQMAEVAVPRELFGRILDRIAC
jgi:hypothetical protein